MHIRQYLAKNAISQAEFAKRVGVSPGMVWQWLSGHRPIAPEKCIPIEEATGGAVKRHELRPDIYPLETS